jgi:hypothetical protein
MGYSKTMTQYSLDSLLDEAAASDLCVQSLCETYWSTHDPRWTCWLRSTTHKDYVAYGSGATAGEALNTALNSALTYEPSKVDISNLTFSRNLPSLDSLLPRKTKVTVAPGAIRRF